MLSAGIYSSKLQAAVSYDVVKMWSFADDPNFPQLPSGSLNFPAERYQGILRIVPLMTQDAVFEALCAFGTGAPLACLGEMDGWMLHTQSHYKFGGERSGGG